MSQLPRSVADSSSASGSLFSQEQAGGEANLVLPDLGQANFFGGAIGGRTLLLYGLLIVALGLVFGLVIYKQLKNAPVHQSMLEISELIYETCKTYLITQVQVPGHSRSLHRSHHRFLLRLAPAFCRVKVLIILMFSVIGICGSYGVAWFGIRVNTFANSRTAFASLRGKPFPCYEIPLKAGMSIGMLLISVELLLMLFILLFIPRDYAGPCFIGFAIGESLGAAALRVAGGIFTKIADIGADLMKIVFKIKEDDARNPGVIADCTGDNAGDSVGPSADGFETYGVTGVALISFILLAVNSSTRQSPAAGLDFCHARDDGGFVGRVVLHQCRDCESEIRQRRRNELRSAADDPGVADFDRLDRSHLPRFLLHDSGTRRRPHLVVEASTRDHLRHAGGRGDSGTREGIHVHGFGARARSSHFVA